MRGHDWQWLPMVGGPKDGELLYINVAAMDHVLVPLPQPIPALFKENEPGEPPSALRMDRTTYAVHRLATPDLWLQHVLVHDSIGWEQLQRWGSRQCVPLIMAAWRARWQRTVCKHCRERVVPSGDYTMHGRTLVAVGGLVHATGPQAGKHRCATHPYGYNAEAMGQPCSGPPNECAGAHGDIPAKVFT